MRPVTFGPAPLFLLVRLGTRISTRAIATRTRGPIPTTCVACSARRGVGFVGSPQAIIRVKRLDHYAAGSYVFSMEPVVLLCRFSSANFNFALTGVNVCHRMLVIGILS